MNIYEAWVKYHDTEQKITCPEWGLNEWIRWDKEQGQWITEEGTVMYCLHPSANYEIWQARYDNEEACRLLVEENMVLQKQGSEPIRFSHQCFIFTKYPHNWLSHHEVAKLFATEGYWVEVNS